MYAEAIAVCDRKVLLHRDHWRTGTSAAMSFYDASTSTIRFVGAGSGGNMWDEVISIRDGVWHIAGTGSSGSGKKRVYVWKGTPQADGKTVIWEGSITAGDSPPSPRRNVWRKLEK